MLSYEKIIAINKEFADNHWIIQNFGNGERWQIVDHDQDASFKYPLMYIEDLPFPVGNKELSYSLRVWFVTRVEAQEDRGSELLYSEYAKAKSDMVRCATDLVAFWVQDVNYPSLEIDKNVSINTFTDRTKDKDTGCYVDIRLKEAFPYDSCIIPMDGVTPPDTGEVTITINDATFADAECNTTYNVVVKDTDGTVVGSKIGNEWIVPAAGGDPASNQVNGAAKTSISAGGSKNFIIRYADDSPVVVTEVSDSATEFIGEVPNAVTAIAYHRGTWTARNTEYNTHDLGWYLANESSVFNYAVDGISPLLDITDKTKLTTLNAFGNLNRITNSLGLTATYDGTGGEIADYAIDHCTGMGWYLQNAVNTNIDFVDSATTLRAATLATFSDWRMLTMQDIEVIITDDAASPSTIFAAIENWSTDLTWIMNSAGTGTGYFWRLNQHIGSSLWMNTRSITSPNASIMTIAIRNHY